MSLALGRASGDPPRAATSAAVATPPRPDERLSPLERLQILCDPESLSLIRSDVESSRMGDRARPGDGVVGAMGRAVGIVHRRPIAEADDPAAAREGFARQYAEEHLSAQAATREGFVDDVVAPSQTRGRLADALAALEAGERVAPGYTNIPL